MVMGIQSTRKMDVPHFLDTPVRASYEKRRAPMRTAVQVFLAAGAALLGSACEFASDPSAPPPPPRTIMCSNGPDTLETGGALVDGYDCTILDKARQYGHPDPMLVKAQIQQESTFSIFSISPDSPCGIEMGWTDAESKSFGLTQVTPACGEAGGTLLLTGPLAGHPNLTTDMQTDLWATSVFNPTLNIDEGVQTMTRDLAAMKTDHPGCTDAEYALMSAGAFNSGPRAVLGCGLFNDRAQNYVTAVLGHYSGFAQRAGWPNPY